MKDQADLARGWITKASSDLAAARKILVSDGPFDTACFHAQQVIEKALKAFFGLSSTTNFENL